ncbi:MAG: helix-turn-helix transcriptional regulator [Chloroflexi bacterium]|nr:MAG: helix-turn-helix transcriptional regulator [Chloroflexota bacterium]
MGAVTEGGDDLCGGDLGSHPVAGLTTVLQALADPVRLAIIRAVAAEPRTCGGFDVPVTKSTLSHHFRVLREAGIIEQRCEGTRKLTSVRRAELEAAYPGLLESILSAPVEEAAAR